MQKTSLRAVRGCSLGRRPEARGTHRPLTLAQPPLPTGQAASGLQGESRARSPCGIAVAHRTVGRAQSAGWEKGAAGGFSLASHRSGCLILSPRPGLRVRLWGTRSLKAHIWKPFALQNVYCSSPWHLLLPEWVLMERRGGGLGEPGGGVCMRTVPAQRARPAPQTRSSAHPAAGALEKAAATGRMLFPQ